MPERRAEHGLVMARGPAHLKRLADAIADDNTALTDEVRELGQMYLEQIDGVTARVAELDGKIKRAAKEADLARRAQTMPGVGPVTALAIVTFALDLTWPPSGVGATLRPGSGSSRSRARQAASPGLARPLRWASATFADCWSLVPLSCM